jgi:hypothetical protein
MKRLPSLAILVCSVFVTSCTSRTYVGTGAPGVPSPDGRYRLTLRCHGAYGKSYISKAKHGARVGIWAPGHWTKTETNLFWHEYTFVASDLWGHIHWNSPQEVTIDFYDFGDGISSGDAEKGGVASNHIATIAYRLDSQTARFVEQK